MKLPYVLETIENCVGSGKVEAVDRISGRENSHSLHGVSGRSSRIERGYFQSRLQSYGYHCGSRVNFVQADALISFLRRHGEAGLGAAQAVSEEYQDACLDIQETLLAPSSAGKLAKLLLSWTNGHDGDREVRVRTVLTHEEMAQMIGASRETVTRVLSDLKKRQLIRLEGSTLVIRNRIGLEELAS